MRLTYLRTKIETALLLKTSHLEFAWNRHIPIVVWSLNGRKQAAHKKRTA
jgi:hypothetical protein